MPNQLSADSDKVTIVLPKELKEIIRKLAAKERRSMSQVISMQLEKDFDYRPKSA
ncbi:ribbon-helix-helix protein, CopG family [Cerasicoccus frondis]|uniref:ribbon-helix-helix protein, CopG family n=1 Tax=Cerasicoccus frondis TaxID=490090 RepID=UPI003CCCC331